MAISIPGMNQVRLVEIQISEVYGLRAEMDVLRKQLATRVKDNESRPADDTVYWYHGTVGTRQRSVLKSANFQKSSCPTRPVQQVGDTNTWSHRLFYIINKDTCQKLLVDSGAAVIQ